MSLILPSLTQHHSLPRDERSERFVSDDIIQFTTHLILLFAGLEILYHFALSELFGGIFLFDVFIFSWERDFKLNSMRKVANSPPIQITMKSFQFLCHVIDNYIQENSIKKSSCIITAPNACYLEKCVTPCHSDTSKNPHVSHEMIFFMIKINI